MFKNSIAFFVCFIWSFCCYSQQSEMAYLDHLIEQYKSKTDEQQLGKVFQAALEKSNSSILKNNLEIVYATLLANLQFEKYDAVTPQIDSLYKKALSKSANSSSDLIIWINTEYAFYLYRNSLYQQAFPYFIKTSRMIEKPSQKLAIQATAILKKNGFYFGSIENYDKANRYYERALEITDKQSFDYGTLLNTIGNNHRRTGNNKLSEKYFAEALAVSKTNGDHVRYAKVLGDYALLYGEKGNWQKAEEYLLKDIAISKKYHSKRNLMFAQIQLGKVYYERNNYEKAVAVLNEAERYAASKSNLKSFEQEIAKIKLAIAMEQKDVQTELEQRRKLEIISAHVSKTDGEQVINSINLEVRNENIKLQLLAEKVKTQDELLVKKVSIAIGVILFLLLILIYRRNRRRMKYQQVEFDQKILLFQIDKQNSETKLKETKSSLASYKTYLIEKNEQVKRLEQEIAKKDNSARAIEKTEILKQLLDSHLLTEDNWLHFKREFVKEQREFYEATMKKYPNLTESNLRLIMLVKMGLTNQNIANLLGVTLDAVKKAKQRLKKKHEAILKELEQ